MNTNTASALPKNAIAYYHLPGLFEFTDLYRAFLPLYRAHRDWFYDWCEIGSIYGRQRAASGVAGASARRIATRRRHWR